MSDPDRPEADLDRLRAKLDRLALEQAEEIGRLRRELRDLERRLDGGKAAPEPRTPPPLPTFSTEMPVVETEVPKPRTEQRIATPQPIHVPARPPAPVPPRPRPAAADSSFELQMGRVWLVRLGIALLVTGLVLLGNYAYRNWIRDLPAVVRLAFLYAGAFALCGTGWWFTRRETMKRFGEVILAGGMAFAYWCTFAAHHVDRLRVVGSPVVAALLLLAAAGVIVAVSLRRGSPATAIMGILLASYSTVLQPLGWLSSASNVVLTMAGVALMRRPGWAGTGIAGMAGIYGSFLWWHLAGAAGGAADPAGLYFLPATWALFTLPSLTRLSSSFGGSLTERGRAWFAGINNGLFFALFSLLWFQLGYREYWQVPAVFGAVLVALGSAARSRTRSVSTHLVQGLAALTLALVIKLDGHHLALGLAIESLVMAGAFLRFRRLPELVFCVLSLVGSAVVTLMLSGVPVWSAGVSALLLAAAGLVVRIGGERCPPGGGPADSARTVTLLAIIAATAVGIISWCLRLPPAWKIVAAEGTGLLLSAIVLKLDRRRWLPELRGSALAFGITAITAMIVLSEQPGFLTYLGAALFAAAAALLWERAADRNGGTDLSSAAPAMAWVFALAVPLALGLAVETSDWDLRSRLLAYVIGVPIVALIASNFLGGPRLRTSLALLLGPALVHAADLPSGFSLLPFLVPASALATLFVSLRGPIRDRAADGILMVFTRAIAVLGWITAWSIVLEDHALEVIALSGAALVVWSATRPARPKLPEAWLLIGIPALGFLVDLAVTSFRTSPDSSSIEGWGAVLALIAAALCASASSPREKLIRKLLLWTSAIFLALWSTRWVVSRFDWHAAAILWTGLGFLLVSAGLWRRLAPWRHAGFALLAISLVRLFAVDVWEFGTFTRVAAFLALGAALVVLGFFYNKFADLLKRLLEDDGR